MTDTIITEEAKEFSVADRERIAAAEKLAAQLGQGMQLEQWLELGEVLLMGRRLAMRLSFTNRPEGKGYNTAFGAWLDAHPSIRDLFPNRSSMSDLLWVVDSAEHRQVLRELRGRWTTAERARINGPSAARKRIVAELRARAAQVEGLAPVEPVEKISLQKRVIQLEAELETERRRFDQGSRFDLEFDPGETIGKIIAGSVTESKWKAIVKGATAVIEIRKKLEHAKKAKPAG